MAVAFLTLSHGPWTLAVSKSTALTAFYTLGGSHKRRPDRQGESSQDGFPHEGVETLEDTVRIARRVLGNSHPTVAGIEESLGHFQAALNTIIT